MSKKDYYRYTDEDKANARAVDMIGFLERNEGYTFKKAGNEWHSIEHDSLVIMADRTGWAWNSKDICGANAIDYCMKIKNMDFQQSLQMIVGQGIGNYTKAMPLPARAKESQPVKLPPKATNFKRAFAYLQKTRGIDANIIAELMHKELIYQDDKNNVVFLGQDEQKKPVFACRRGTISNSDKPAFKGDCKNSDKRYNFTLEGVKRSKLFVFESPIDVLSHATLAILAMGKDDAWKLHSRLSLSGKSDLALEHYLKTHPEVKDIALCLDNDVNGKDDKGNHCNHGQIAAQKLADKYTKLGYNVTNLPPRGGKDYNEDLLIIKSNMELDGTAIKANNREPER